MSEELTRTAAKMTDDLTLSSTRTGTVSTIAVKPAGDMNAALKHIWKEYRRWAATSHSLKSGLTTWRHCLLGFSIGGALLATLSQSLTQPGQTGIWSHVPTVIGLVSAVVLALAAYFTNQILTRDHESQWIRSRAAAEALKSEAYLLATQTPPYDQNNSDIAFDKTEKIVSAANGIDTKSISKENEVKGLPRHPMPLAVYIDDRLNKQLEFYEDRTRGYRKSVDKSKQVSFWLGAVAVIFGVVVGLVGTLTGWIGLIGTITASIAAYLYSERFQFLITSYQATARRLENLRDKWTATIRTEDATGDQNGFILKCEEIMATETGAWMAEWAGNKK